MTKRPLPVLVCTTALALASAALASGPSPGVSQGRDGVLAPSGTVRYFALPARGGTMVERVGVRDGRLLSFRVLQGSFGEPRVAFDGSLGGVSHDGRTLVLASAGGRGGLRSVSRLLVLDATTLALRREIVLRGDFSYDALSPDAAVLYLVQHVSAADPSRYVVRAYDVRTGRLLRGIVSDKREHETTMAGLPLARATSPGGAWVYTLYDGAGGTPFVHALDTLHRRAVCLDLYWHGSQDELTQAGLVLARNGAQLVLVRRSDGGRLLVLAAPR